MTDKQTDPYKIDTLNARKEKARKMGGEAKVERQHNKGRLSARERIEHLLDDHSFDEVGLLAHSDIPAVKDKTPADGKVCGFGEINQKDVFVSADDVTVLAGAGGRIGVAKGYEKMAYAQKKGIPCVHLGDAGGARIPDIMGSDGMMSMTYSTTMSEPRDRKAPLITAIMGECMGGPTWTAAASDIVVQVKGTVMCVGGSSILKIATGEQTTDEELGGWELHAHHTGLVDLFAEDEEHCLELIRQVLSYLPNSAKQLPSVRPCHDDPNARLDAVLDVVPENPKQPYDMHHLLELIADQDSVLELRPYFDASLITALVRIDGHVTGVLANNPMVTAGAMGPGACEKATAFIALCDSFNIPLLFLHDTPGFLVGKAAEDRKMSLQIIRFIDALHHCTVPRVSLIIRKSYGMAHCNMSGGKMGSDHIMAWPTADVSFMAPDVAVNVAFGRKLEGSENAETEKQMYIEAMQQSSEPWQAAGLNLLDDIIDPRDTRKKIIKAFRRARGSDGLAGMSKRLMASWPKMV